MFDLEQAITEWRRRMLAAGIKTPVPLEELENHLREDFEAEIRTGAVPERAFEMAVRRLGLPTVLRQEFGKLGEVMSAWKRKVIYTVLAVVAGLCCAAGVIFLVVRLHLSRGERISAAGAFLSMAFFLSAGPLLGRFFPVLPGKYARAIVSVACLSLSLICAVRLLPHFSLGNGTMEEFLIAIVWVFYVPMTAVVALGFGLEEAAYRSAQRRAC